MEIDASDLQNPLGPCPSILSSLLLFSYLFLFSSASVQPNPTQPAKSQTVVLAPTEVLPPTVLITPVPCVWLLAPTVLVVILPLKLILILILPELIEDALELAIVVVVGAVMVVSPDMVLPMTIVVVVGVVTVVSPDMVLPMTIVVVVGVVMVVSPDMVLPMTIVVGRVVV